RCLSRVNYPDVSGVFESAPVSDSEVAQFREEPSRHHRLPARNPVINYELGGKVAVVTGAASGIGLACAEVLARSGATVELRAWDVQCLRRAPAELQADGDETPVAVVDVGDACGDPGDA